MKSIIIATVFLSLQSVSAAERIKSVPQVFYEVLKLVQADSKVAVIVSGDLQRKGQTSITMAGKNPANGRDCSMQLQVSSDASGIMVGAYVHDTLYTKLCRQQRSQALECREEYSFGALVMFEYGLLRNEAYYLKLRESHVWPHFLGDRDSVAVRIDGDRIEMKASFTPSPLDNKDGRSNPLPDRQSGSMSCVYKF